jgi:hypothetical protein
LSEPAISALRVAAVLGPAFAAADLGIVTGRRGSELTGVAEALKAGVLAEPVPGTLAFRHGLVHQALYHPQRDARRRPGRGHPVRRSTDGCPARFC